MKNKKEDIDIKNGIKKIEELIINNIFYYLKNGVFPENSSSSYMDAYILVENLSDMGENYSAQLFQYYNKTIESYILECKNELASENSINFIDKFLEHINKINFLIYFMWKLFTYLDRFYTKARVGISLSESAMNLYKLIFYEDIKNNIFIEINKLINEDRNGNKEEREKIKNIVSILKDLDL